MAFKNRLKFLARGLLLMSGLTRLARWWHREQVLILMFHGFTDEEHSGTVNCDGKHLHTRRLRDFLAYMKGRHSIVSLSEAMRYLQGELAALPPNPVVLTFDDGYRSNALLAGPVLREFDAPASVFLVSSFVGTQTMLWVDELEYAFELTGVKELTLQVGDSELAVSMHSRTERVRALLTVKAAIKAVPQEHLATEVSKVLAALKVVLPSMPPPLYQSLSWEEVRELEASGSCSIGCHTHTHRILSRCSVETMREELSVNQSIIAKHTGQVCDLFCYPNGRAEDRSEQTEAVLAELGFSCALTTERGFNRPGVHPFRLVRYDVPNVWELNDFVLTVSGLMPLLRGLFQRIRRSSL